MKRKVFSLFLSGIIVLSFTGCGASQENPSAVEGGQTVESVENSRDLNMEMIRDDDSPIDPSSFLNLNADGYVVFGNYEQDGDLSNGSEPIEWEVVTVKNAGVLLMSRYILDAQPYDTEKVETSWESCSLRNWLNNDFYNSAFDDAEKELVKDAKLDNGNRYSFSNYAKGNDTIDKVFCLSYSEIYEYYDVYNITELDSGNTALGYGCDELMAEVTEYYLSRSDIDLLDITSENYNEKYQAWLYSEDIIGKQFGPWWMRDISDAYKDHAYFMGRNGILGPTAVVNADECGVRPAIFVCPPEDNSEYFDLDGIESPVNENLYKYCYIDTFEGLYITPETVPQDLENVGWTLDEKSDTEIMGKNSFYGATFRYIYERSPEKRDYHKWSFYSSYIKLYYGSSIFSVGCSDEIMKEIYGTDYKNFEEYSIGFGSSRVYSYDLGGYCIEFHFEKVDDEYLLTEAELIFYDE